MTSPNPPHHKHGHHHYSLDSFSKLSLAPHAYPRVDVAPFNMSFSISPRLKIVMLGDSLTQQGVFPDGWCSLLTSRYQRRADLFNRGYSGFTTRTLTTTVKHHLQAGIFPFIPAAPPTTASIQGSNQIINTAVPGHFTTLMTLCIGTNDAAFPDLEPPEIHVPLIEFEHNLKQLIALLIPEYSQLTSSPDKFLSSTTALILITPPQLDEPRFRQYQTETKGTPQVQGRDLNTTRRYAEIIKKVGHEWQIPVVDLFTLTAPIPHIHASEIHQIGELFYPWFSDGLHFNAAGNAVLFDGILDVIEMFYPSLSVERLGLDAPPFEAWEIPSNKETSQQKETFIVKWPNPPNTTTNNPFNDDTDTDNK